MKSVATTSIAVLCLVAASTTTAFAPSIQQITTTASSSTNSALFAKGFGEKPAPKQKSQGAIQREQESSRYDEISSAGGQEYSVFVRQFGSDDKSWLPCGAIAVPRGAQVSDAIYANEAALKASITRTYDKLAGMEDEFEFGFHLKIYPDEPIEVATKNAPKAQGLSLGNWISTLLSPVDTSKVPPPPTMKD